MNIQKQRHDLHQYFIICVPSAVSGTLSWSRNIQGFDNWQWQKLNVLHFYVLTCAFFRGKENIDKMKTKVDPIYISNMYNKQETEIDRDHKPLLCLLPLSSTIPSPQRNCLHPRGHPVPAGSAEPRVTGLDVHRSTGMTANPSGNHTESMTVRNYAWILQPKDGRS